MANKVTIDVEARFIDNVTDEAKAAAKSFGDVEKSAEEAKKDIDKLGKTNAKPKVTMDSNSAAKKLDALDKKLNKIGKSKTEAKLSILDKATAAIDKVTSKAKAFANKTYSGLVKLRDSNVLSSLNKMSNGLKSLTSKAWSVAVKIKDTFTAPLTRLKNMLFNVKTLIAGIASAWAATKLIMAPINVADAYSSAKISFSTLLGESQGQKMMDDLDQFAKATPFNTTNVIGNAQKMLAMGWDPENIIHDMEIIGNAAAATGKLDQGLESIVRAMSQIKTKGRLSTEELNQLAEAGIAAKAMLAEELGFGTGDEGIAAMTKVLEDTKNGGIASNVAIEALLRGMKKYDGMMETMANETVEGLWAQIQDAFSINVVRKWGQGLQDGAKKGFGTVVTLLDEAEDALAEFGDMLYDIGKMASNWVADKFQVVVDKIIKITDTSEFENASMRKKISMLWNGVVVDPLKEWWDNGGEQKTAETAGKIGSWMGEMLTKGLLALFGATDVLDGGLGTDAGSKVAGSFLQGFLDNFDGQAITDAFVNAIGNVWGALPAWAKVLLGGYSVGKTAGGISNLAGGAANLIDYVKKAIGSFSIASSSYPILTSSGTGIAGLLGKAGVGLGASTAGGAVLLGGAGVTGGVVGGVGILSGLADIVKGIKSYGKQAKDRYFQGGTKLAMVGTGALAGGKIGAAIGSAGGPVGTGAGALIGAGLGGLAALIGGDDLGKWLSDLTDDPAALKESISKFFTVTLPEKWNDFWDGVGNFFTETVPYAIGYATGKAYTFFTETLPEKWGMFWSSLETFFTETIPTWASDVWTNKIVPFWTETLPAFFPMLWDSVQGFFTEELPKIAEAIWGGIKSFFTETIPGWARSVVDSFASGFNEGSGGKSGGEVIGGVISGALFGTTGYARGGIVGGSTRFIRVNEESPEMIIPLSDQRRDRALKLWAKTGEMLDVPGFARGGNTDGSSHDEGIRFRTYGGNNTEGGRTIQVNMGGIKLEIHVSGSDRENIVEAIKAQAGDLADYFVGLIADALETEFENTPVRGDVA